MKLTPGAGNLIGGRKGVSGSHRPNKLWPSIVGILCTLWWLFKIINIDRMIIIPTWMTGCIYKLCEILTKQCIFCIEHLVKIRSRCDWFCQSLEGGSLPPVLVWCLFRFWIRLLVRDQDSTTERLSRGWLMWTCRFESTLLTNESL